MLRRKFSRSASASRPLRVATCFRVAARGDIVPSLNRLIAEFQELMLGSSAFEDHRQTLLTLGRATHYVQQALDSLLARLPGDAIHKVSMDRPPTIRCCVRWRTCIHLDAGFARARCADAARGPRAARAAGARAARPRHAAAMRL
jgi:hypothetical protein